jgi:membrane associated rhomboid family serine protease
MSDADEHPAPLFTYTALTAMVAVFVVEFTHSDLSMLECYPWRLGQGQWWRLITCTFLHGGVMHIAFNMMLFFYFGRVVENWLGPWIALALYVFLAAGSSAGQVLSSGGLVVGASGVVYGLFGFLWAARRRWYEAQHVITPNVIEGMLGWLGLCVVLSWLNVPIANTAHAVGLALGWLLGRAFERGPWRWATGAASVVLGVALVVCTDAPVWNALRGSSGAFGVLHYRPDPLSPTDRDYLEHLPRPEPGFFM